MNTFDRFLAGGLLGAAGTAIAGTAAVQFGAPSIPGYVAVVFIAALCGLSAIVAGRAA